MGSSGSPLLVLVLSSLALGVAAPATAAVPGDLIGRAVVEIVVEGASDGPSGTSAREVFGIRVGDTLEAAAVRLGIKRVFLTGTWADVRVYGEPRGAAGVRLILHVEPDLLIGEVVLLTSGALPPSRLRPAIRLTPGDRFRPESVEEARRALKRAAADLGWPAAEVETSIEPLRGGEQRLRFVVELGTPTRIESVELSGDPKLARAEVLREIGVVAGQPFDRLELEQGLGRVKERLVEARHLAAAASILEIDYGETQRAVRLRVRVVAGPRYRIDYVGNHAIADAYLRVHLNEARLGALDASARARGIRRIETFYKDAGYARVRVTIDEVPAYKPWSRDAERILRFIVEEGPRVIVSELFVEGGEAKDGRGLAADMLAFVVSEMPSGGLIQRLDVGDALAVLGDGRRRREPERPVDVYEVASSFLPQLAGDPVYIERVFEAAAQRLADRYRKDGFLGVEVKGPEPIWLDDGATVRIRYRIEEGLQTRVAGVRFTPEPTLPLAELLEEVTLEPGAAADLYAIEETRLTLQRNLRERGFPFARVEERLERLSEPGLAELIYEIEEGPRVRLGKIRVRGNTNTQEFVIVDRVVLREGDYFAASKVEESRQRLLRTGLFTAVSIGFLDDKADAEVRDLLVEVRERKLNAVEPGFGGSIEDGPRVFLSYERRNIFGLGVGMRARAQVNYPRLLYPFLFPLKATGAASDDSPDGRFFLEEPELLRALLFLEGQGLIGAEIPKVYGLPFDARLFVDGVFLREIRQSFTLLKGSVLTGFDAQPFQWLTIGPQLEAEVSDFNCPNLDTLGIGCGEGASGLTRRTDAGTLGQLTMRLLSSMDLRDDPFRPHAGFFSSFATDVAFGAGVLRDSGQGAGDVESNFIRLSGTASGYVPLGPEATLALTVRGGNIFPLTTLTPGTPNYVPLFKRFYLGGTSSLRGFNADVLLPSDDENWPATQRDPNPDIDPASISSLGGNFFVNARAELRLGVVGDLELGTFVDVGQLANDVVNVQLAGFAIGAGLGMRYNTPVGPFAVDFGWKVIDGQRRLPPLLPDRAVPNLHLSIGYF